jgi:hypothetical protein
MFYKYSKKSKGKMLTKCDNLMKHILRHERKHYCQLCGKPNKAVGTFHILPKSTHPRLRYIKQNLLLTCWGCHYKWHSNYYKAQHLEGIIKKILGDDYKERLEIVNKTIGKQDILLIYIGLENELKELEAKKIKENL